MTKKKAATKQKAAVKKSRTNKTATAERRFPLDVLLVSPELGGSCSAHEGCVRSLVDNPAVRSYGFTDSQDEAEQVIAEGKVNTVLIDPCSLTWDAAPFILNVRSSHPKIVFVLYADAHCRDRFCTVHPRFSKYFHLERFENYCYCTTKKEMADYQAKLDEVIRECEYWQRQLFQFDFAISFAGDQRQHAEDLARRLSALSARVFYDRFEQSNLIGNDLYTKLYDVYSKYARFCIMLISKSYVTKVWTTLERQAIQDRILNDKGQGYLIPVRIDDTVIPGLPATLAFSDIQDGVESLSWALIEKVSISMHDADKKCFCDTRSLKWDRWTRFCYQDPSYQSAWDKLEAIVSRGQIQDRSEYLLVRRRIAAVESIPESVDELTKLRALVATYKGGTS